MTTNMSDQQASQMHQPDDTLENFLFLLTASAPPLPHAQWPPTCIAFLKKPGALSISLWLTGTHSSTACRLLPVKDVAVSQKIHCCPYTQPHTETGTKGCLCQHGASLTCLTAGVEHADTKHLNQTMVPSSMQVQCALFHGPIA